MSLYIASKLHKSVLIREDVLIAVFQAAVLCMPARGRQRCPPGTVAPLMALNGDSICSHDFPQHAFLSLIII